MIPRIYCAQDRRRAIGQMPRYLLCVDLEATCDSDPDFVPFMEVIEIGAVMLELEEGEVVAEFSSFIRPVLMPHLTPFCTELTTITQQNVDQAPGYGDVLAAIDEFLQPFGDAWSWCSWGNYDKNQLLLDARRHRLPPLLDPERHTNLKKIFAKQRKEKMVGLKQATRQLKLEWIGTHHRGIDDARNLVGVALNILASEAERGFRPAVSSHSDKCSADTYCICNGRPTPGAPDLA